MLRWWWLLWEVGVGCGLCSGPRCYETLKLGIIDNETGKKYLHMAQETSTLMVKEKRRKEEKKKTQKHKKKHTGGSRCVTSLAPANAIDVDAAANAF